jgi:hypothetical protein
MGAYENPRLINAPNYLAGFQAFEQKFQKGFEEGIEMGKKKIEADKLYVEGVEEAGEKMRLQGEAAIANSAKTREEVESALKNFYDDALAVEPGGKGLAGLFSGGRQMLGDMDLRKLQNNFTDKITPLNEMYNRIYDPEFNLTKDSDMSDAQYSKLEEIHNAVKSGRIRTNFSYYSQEEFPDSKGMDRGFNSKLEILDANGKVINTYSSSELSQIMNNNTQQVRAGIDERHSLVGANAETYMNRSTSNVKTDLTVNADPNARVLSPENHLDAGISQQIGTAGFYNENGLSIQPNANGEYTSVPDITGELNGLYANHGKGKLTSQEEIAILKRTVPSLANVDDSKLKLILDNNMNMGTEKIKAILGDDFKFLQTAGAVRPLVDMKQMTPEEVLKSIHDGQAVSKAVIYHESIKKSIVDKGLLNQSYVPPVTQERGATQGEINLQASNNKSQTDLNKVTNVINRIPSNLVGETYNQGENNVPTLDFNTIRRSDGKGGFVVKEVIGQNFNPVTGKLTLKYEQESKVVESTDEEGLTTRGVTAPDVSETYDIHTIPGLRKLYEDVLMDATDLDKKTRSTYFEDNIIKTLNSQWMNSPSYLDKFDRETHNKMINAYGGFEAAKKLDIFNSRPWFQNIMREKRQKK